MREEMTTLGESCQFFNGKAHEKDIDAEGKFVVVNSKFISTDGEVKKFTKKQMFPLVENDIVMVMSDVPNGKALAKCYVIEENDKYSLNQRICAIRTTEFNIRFLYYQLNRHPYLLAFNNGENQTNLRKGDILNCPLWKPSLDVQERIVKILDEALDQIEQAQGNIEQNILNAIELFQSKLNNIFSQKGDGWNEKTIIELCNHKSQIVGGPFGSNLKVKDYRESGIPILRLQNIGKGYFIDKDIKYVSEEKAKELEYHSFEAGDIVLAKLGIPIGKTCIVPDKFPFGIVVADVVRIRPNKSEINYDFLKHFLNSDNSVKQLTADIRGATRPRVNIAEVRNLKLSVPSIETFRNELIAKYENKSLLLENFKNSILHKAFSGHLINQQKPITV